MYQRWFEILFFFYYFILTWFFDRIFCHIYFVGIHIERITIKKTKKHWTKKIQKLNMNIQNNKYNVEMNNKRNLLRKLHIVLFVIWLTVELIFWHLRSNFFFHTAYPTGSLFFPYFFIERILAFFSLNFSSVAFLCFLNCFIVFIDKISKSCHWLKNDNFCNENRSNVTVQSTAYSKVNNFSASSD